MTERFQEEYNYHGQLSDVSFRTNSDVSLFPGCLCVLRGNYWTNATYGCQVWVLTKAQLQRLQVTQRSNIIGQNQEYLHSKKTNVTDVAAFCKKLKWEFAGKISRTAGKWTLDVLNWTPEGKRGRGRPRPRWEDEIKKMAGENWKKIAKDKKAWSNLGETFMQQWIDASPNSN